MSRPTLTALALLCGSLFPLLSCQSPPAPDTSLPLYRSWTWFGGGPDNIHYSTLDQINTGNVQHLAVAWTFDTGDAFDGAEMQCNPIIIDGVLYATTPKLRVIALDAATGALRWAFDPNPPGTPPGTRRNRGLSYWAEGSDKRLFFAFDHHLYALDATTGQPAVSFGTNGRLDLREGLGRDTSTVGISLNTPGVVYRDLLIVGSATGEDLPAAPGHIRAFDVRTGALRWTFHTIPQPGEYGYDTWPAEAYTYTGGANNWSGMALDTTRGLVFVPTGSAAFDFYGADRHGDNLFANTLLCLDAATGERVWHFQFVHHDVWDRDLPSAPSLVTLEQDGRRLDAVAQITKSGHVLVFERETGTPVFPIEERPVSTVGVPGEQLAPTQPFPTAPPAFSRQVLTEHDLTQRTPATHAEALERFRAVRSHGPFEPPSHEGTVVFPGFDGGAEWGGAAFDPETGLFYVNANEMAWILRLVERPQPGAVTSARSLYDARCAACHRSDLGGTPPAFPALRNLGDRLAATDIAAVIREGRGRMPANAALGDTAIAGLTRFLLTGQDEPVTLSPTLTAANALRYTTDGYNRFLDAEGYPAITPPWGTLNALDLNTGTLRWQIPLGEYPALAAQGITNTGSENYGGAVVTKGGLLFIGATNFDRMFRAFDKATGALLWKTELPAAGNATPATYEVNGRQFVVIAAGGGKGGPSGGSYVAFALP